MIARRTAVVVLSGLVAACGGDDGEGGGSAGSGGVTGSGGRTGSGGAAGSGGTVPEPPPVACGSEPFEPPTSGGRVYYVALDGDDSAAGTIDAPFLSLDHASRVARGGDIVYVRGGVYNRTEDVTSAAGEAGTPVVFMAYPGEQPILDGDGLDLGPSDSVLQLYRPQHVVVAGLEIRNSAGRGLQLIDAEDVAIRDSVIHDVGYKAIGLNGNNLLAEGNVVYNAVLSNANSDAGGGWASAVTTQLLEDGSPSSNVVVRGNSVRDVWGECIDALFVEGMTISGNEVEDCYSVGIYVDTARSVRVEGNVVRASDDAYRRSGSGRLMDGILLGSEAAAGAESPDFGAEGVVVANNLILGTHDGIAWWNAEENSRASNTYLDIEIVSNVVFGEEGAAIMFDGVPAGRTPPARATLVDNILYSGAENFLIGNPEAWIITSNVFPDGVPPVAADPSNVATDPELAAPAVAAPAEAFRPSDTSPCRNAGEPVASVPLDFACAPRGADRTTIGAFE